MRDFNELAIDIHRRNRKWWFTSEGVRLIREPGELFMLAVSEVAEAMEGLRKSKPGAPLMDDKIPTRPMEEVELADTVIRLVDSSVGLDIGLDLDIIGFREPLVYSNRATTLLLITSKIVETNNSFAVLNRLRARIYLSAAISLCYDYAAEYGYDLDGAIDEKLAYNDNRVDHSYEARAAAGGKAF